MGANHKMLCYFFILFYYLYAITTILVTYKVERLKVSSLLNLRRTKYKKLKKLQYRKGKRLHSHKTSF